MKSLVTVAMAAAAVAPGTHALRILQASEESWADLTVRNLHAKLTAANHSAVLVGPTKHCTRSGRTDRDPEPLMEACQFSSCPAGANATSGRNETDPTLQWLNAHPKTCMRVGLESMGPMTPGWDGREAQFAVAGPSGAMSRTVNAMPLALFAKWTATARAAAWAAFTGVPAIAFASAQDGQSFAWNDTSAPAYTRIYPELAARLVEEIVAAGPPYLPEGVFLNVNFPPLTDKCDHPDKFKWVMTHRPSGWNFWGPRVVNCGKKTRLPDDGIGIRRPEKCYISVTAVDSWYMETHPAPLVHYNLLKKLEHLWYCTPTANLTCVIGC
ncbi:5'-nucleotidase [Purpureocillium takamizusanense]|uniref:5'-nucleotidase n=1 Tax=Purpureocillium takamizusanense TaxID=2060973 RepID=A0A9Q8QFC1_9HYPO|nr:5'-nucleotidase [Purpureocillium takamizusanense]UNI18523.1 5'-nucleotidase [Purpureocillium takamizusanense]